MVRQKTLAAVTAVVLFILLCAVYAEQFGFASSSSSADARAAMLDAERSKLADVGSFENLTKESQSTKAKSQEANSDVELQLSKRRALIEEWERVYKLVLGAEEQLQSVAQQILVTETVDGKERSIWHSKIRTYMGALEFHRLEDQYQGAVEQKKLYLAELGRLGSLLGNASTSILAMYPESGIETASADSAALVSVNIAEEEVLPTQEEVIVQEVAAVAPVTLSFPTTERGSEPGDWEKIDDAFRQDLKSLQEHLPFLSMDKSSKAIDEKVEVAKHCVSYQRCYGRLQLLIDAEAHKIKELQSALESEDSAFFARVNEFIEQQVRNKIAD